MRPLIIIMLLLSTTLPAYAKLLQIIHSNDLHSFFSGTRSGRGGYARIKTLVDKLKADAKAQGIPTLFLDAGDFGEGSSYYVSNEGVDAIKGLDLLGVDFTVLGNHDYMQGAQELSEQLDKAAFKGQLLSANLKGRNNTELGSKIKKYVDYDLDGMKVRIFGLSTPEIHFQYPLLPKSFIAPSHRAGIRMARKSQKDKVDFLIALTHIGMKKDTILAEHSRSIDLIIGGHSHTRLEQPLLVKNLRGNDVPIVQTGAHGTALGSMIVDILGESEFKLVDYKLHDITSDIPEENLTSTFIQNAYEMRDQYFGRSWNELIGVSEIVLTGTHEGRIRNPQSCWSKHLARITREAGDADIGLQFDNFQGEEIPAGPIHFGDMIDNFPHFRKWGDNGWKVARARLSGFVLKLLLKSLSNSVEPVNITMDFDEKYFAKNKINNLQFYTVALPSEVPVAMEFASIIRDALIKDLEYVEGTDYWTLLENYIRSHSPIKCLEN